jgi:hypothetical protein
MQKDNGMDLNKNIANIREEFPALKYKTYMNSAAHGSALRRVWDAVQDFWTFRMNEDPDPLIPDAKGEAARLIHADEDEITWCARFVWLPFREEGVEIRRIKNKDGRIAIEDFEKAIEDDTRVVSISRIEWTSGLRQDMRAISAIARRGVCSRQGSGPREEDGARGGNHTGECRDRSGENGGVAGCRRGCGRAAKRRSTGSKRALGIALSGYFQDVLYYSVG